VSFQDLLQREIESEIKVLLKRLRYIDSQKRRVLDKIFQLKTLVNPAVHIDLANYQIKKEET